MNTSIPNSDKTVEEINWAKFWETSGSLSAEVIAGRLRAEGIPTWVWQQGAGAAMGLTFGPMGRGHVMVPEDQLENARRVMAIDHTPDDIVEEGWQDSDPDPSDLDNGKDWLSKSILAVIALVVSPVGVAAAFVVAMLVGGKEQSDTKCPDCDIFVDLDEAEESQGWFICPECSRTVFVN